VLSGQPMLEEDEQDDEEGDVDDVSESDNDELDTDMIDERDSADDVIVFVNIIVEHCSNLMMYVVHPVSTTKITGDTDYIKKDLG